MKKILTVLAAAIAAISLSINAGATDPSLAGIKVNRYSIQSIQPTGLTEVTGSLALNVTNSGRKKLTLSDISGVVYAKNGQVFISGTADDFTLENGTSDIVINGRGRLGSLSAIKTVLSNGFRINPGDYTVDITAKVKIGKKKKAKDLVLKNVPLNQVIGR